MITTLLALSLLTTPLNPALQQSIDHVRVTTPYDGPIRGVLVNGKTRVTPRYRFDDGVIVSPSPIPLGDWDCSESDTQGCTDDLDDVCEDAGYSEVVDDTVRITRGADGSLTCSGTCSGGNNAQGWINCNPPGDDTPNGISDTPDPVDTRACSDQGGEWRDGICLVEVW